MEEVRKDTKRWKKGTSIWEIYTGTERRKEKLENEHVNKRIGGWMDQRKGKACRAAIVSFFFILWEQKVTLNKLLNLIQRNILSLSAQSFIPSTFSLYIIALSFSSPSPFWPFSVHYNQNESVCFQVHMQVYAYTLDTFYTVIACVSLLSWLASVCMCALCMRVISSECRRVMRCLQCWPSEC